MVLWVFTQRLSEEIQTRNEAATVQWFKNFSRKEISRSACSKYFLAAGPSCRCSAACPLDIYVCMRCSAETTSPAQTVTLAALRALQTIQTLRNGGRPAGHLLFLVLGLRQFRSSGRCCLGGGASLLFGSAFCCGASADIACEPPSDFGRRVLIFPQVTQPTGRRTTAGAVPVPPSGCRLGVTVGVAGVDALWRLRSLFRGGRGCDGSVAWPSPA